MLDVQHGGAEQAALLNTLHTKDMSRLELRKGTRNVQVCRRISVTWHQFGWMSLQLHIMLETRHATGWLW